MYIALATAPQTIPASTKPKKTSGPIQPYFSRLSAVMPKPYSPIQPKSSWKPTSGNLNSGSKTPPFLRVIKLAIGSAARPQIRRPTTAPISAEEKRKPVCCGLKKSGGSTNIGESTMPIKTVQPIMTPCVIHAQTTPGCRNRGNGRKKSFQYDSWVLRPLKGSNDFA